MGDFINRFMTGKKKYTGAIVIPTLVALAVSFGLDESAATEVLVILVPLVGGLGYAIIEGINDNKKITPAATESPATTQTTTNTATATTPPPVETPAAQTETGRYLEPIDPSEFVADDGTMSRYNKWEAVEDYFQMNLKAYHPDVRFEYAKKILSYAWTCWADAWYEAFSLAGAKEAPALPGASDFDGYDLKEPLKSELEKLLPDECARLSTKVINISALGIACVKLYETQDALDMLNGKSINWNLARSINDLTRLGLKVIG